MAQGLCNIDTFPKERGKRYSFKKCVTLCDIDLWYHLWLLIYSAYVMLYYAQGLNTEHVTSSMLKYSLLRIKKRHAVYDQY